MGAGRRPSYNSRTGTWTRPKAWYDTGRKRGRKKKNGCYIATSVYGSYDCPEVWTLRRYRDNKLATTLYGRIFIETYYAISPAIVCLFGKKKWFNYFWKKVLDKMVWHLRQQGFVDTPYSDYSIDE